MATSQEQVLFALVASHDEETNELISMFPSQKSTKEIESTTNYITNKILPAIPRQNHKRILLHDNKDLAYKVADNIAFFVVSRTGSARSLAMDLLDDMEGFVEARGADPEDLRVFLKGKVEYYNDASNNKIYTLKQRVDDVKDQMIVNIDKLLERGERLESILQSVEELSSDADQYRHRARRVKNMMWRKYVMIAIALGLVIFAIFIVLIFILCGFPTFYRCRRGSN